MSECAFVKMPFCSYIHVDTSHKYSFIQDNQISIGMIQTQHFEFAKLQVKWQFLSVFFIAKKKYVEFTFYV